MPLGGSFGALAEQVGSKPAVQRRHDGQQYCLTNSLQLPVLKNVAAFRQVSGAPESYASRARGRSTRLAIVHEWQINLHASHSGRNSVLSMYRYVPKLCRYGTVSEANCLCGAVLFALLHSL